MDTWEQALEKIAAIEGDSPEVVEWYKKTLRRSKRYADLLKKMREAGTLEGKAADLLHLELRDAVRALRAERSTGKWESALRLLEDARATLAGRR